MLKRGFDIVASLIGIIGLSPIFLAIGLLIAVTDGFPVIFTQARTGKNQKPFRIFKFRTMSASTKDALQVTAGNDPRITRLGVVLRRTKLDELPQLFNVLKGDMSLVGPRPEVPKYVALWSDGQRSKILSVRPGITDRTQLKFIDEEKILAASQDPECTYINEIMPKRLAMCEDYIKTRSFVDDIVILLATIQKLLLRRRAD